MNALLALKSHERRVRVRVRNGEDPQTAERAERDVTLKRLGYSDAEVAAMSAELREFPVRYVLGVNQCPHKDLLDATTYGDLPNAVKICAVCAESFTILDSDGA